VSYTHTYLDCGGGGEEALLSKETQLTTDNAVTVIPFPFYFRFLF